MLSVRGQCAWAVCKDACMHLHVREYTQSRAHHEGNSLTSFMPSFFDNSHLQCALHNSRRHQSCILGCEWCPSELRNAMTQPLRRDSWPDSGCSLRVFTALLQLLWEELEEMCPRVGTQALGTQQKSSLLPQDSKRTLICFFLMGPGQIVSAYGFLTH